MEYVTRVTPTPVAVPLSVNHCVRTVPGVVDAIRVVRCREVTATVNDTEGGADSTFPVVSVERTNTRNVPFRGAFQSRLQTVALGESGDSAAAIHVSDPVHEPSRSNHFPVSAFRIEISTAPIARSSTAVPFILTFRPPNIAPSAGEEIVLVGGEESVTGGVPGSGDGDGEGDGGGDAEGDGDGEGDGVSGSTGKVVVAGVVSTLPAASAAAASTM